MSRFDGKVAFVTGPTSGIGRATALPSPARARASSLPTSQSPANQGLQAQAAYAATTPWSSTAARQPDADGTRAVQITPNSIDLQHGPADGFSSDVYRQPDDAGIAAIDRQIEAGAHTRERHDRTTVHAALEHGACQFVRSVALRRSVPDA